MKLFYFITLLLFSTSSYSQSSDPSPYCGVTYWGGQYNMINTIDVGGTTHSFGAMGSWIATDPFVYQNTLLFPDLVKGQSTNFEIDFYSPQDGEPILFGVFIDFNQNDVFDANELVMTNSNTTNAALPTWGAPVVLVTLSVPIPNTAMNGTTRMRVIRGEGSGFVYNPADVIASCLANASYGCYYDFDVNITDIGVGNIDVTSIDVQGQGGASTISTQNGTLQMVESVLPANATDNSVTWSVTNGTGSATISSVGLVSATANGTVTVTATANDGSGVSGASTVTISNQTVGVAEIENNTFSIYPNPSSDFIQIYTMNKEVYQNLTIYSLDGKIVLETISLIKKIDVRHLNKGSYIIVLEPENGPVIIEQFVKE